MSKKEYSNDERIRITNIQIESIKLHIENYKTFKERLTEEQSEINLSILTLLKFTNMLISNLLNERNRNKGNLLYTYWISTQINYHNKRKLRILKYLQKQNISNCTE